MPPESAVISISDIDDIEKEETPLEKTEQDMEKDDDFEAKDDEIIKGDHDEDEDELEDDCNSSPRSDWSVRVRTDLSKACQTFGNSVASYSSPPPPSSQDCIEETLYVQTEAETEQTEFYYETAQDEEEEIAPAQETETVFVPSTSETAPTATEQINFVDVDEMQIMLSGEFMGGQLISQVENFESNNQSGGDLMTLGGSEYPEDRSASRESAIANIRADERMPARGELSGQESNGGASDIAWTQVASGSYDLMARENWEVSDASDGENSRNNHQINARFSPQMVDMPTVVSYTEPPLNFKCSTCGDAFKCLQERQQHVKEKHRSGGAAAAASGGGGSSSSSSSSSAEQQQGSLNLIGADIGKKKVKKLVVKPKKEEIDITENNFDNVFTNKLKTEAGKRLFITFFLLWLLSYHYQILH